MDARTKTPGIRQIMTRYKDAYRVGRAIVTVGDAIKATGVVAGIIMALVFIALLDAMGLRLPGVVLGVVSGGVVGVLLYVIGIIVAAQGQVLKATLDSAVNTSPFLTNERRAEVMSLDSEQEMIAEENKQPTTAEEEVALYAGAIMEHVDGTFSVIGVPEKVFRTRQDAAAFAQRMKRERRL